MEDENFRQELEDLFRLFKRLVEKESLDELPGVDAQQLEQLKAFMAQFDDVKDKLKIESVHVDPFTKMMVSSLVKQLREQLDDDMGDIERIEEANRVSMEEPTSVAAIDEMLKNPNLTDAEIDALLDRRSQISNKLS
jgi:hypothetical protein